MVKSKRKASAHNGVSTKKQKETSDSQPSCSFDDLCDNTLLRILSYTDDLRSLISLTRCTSKSLRKRFDIKGDNNAHEYSEQYKKFWMGVLVDLQMTPLEESDSKSQDYVAAINYRLSIFNTLIGHEKRRKAVPTDLFQYPCVNNISNLLIIPRPGIIMMGMKLLMRKLIFQVHSDSYHVVPATNLLW